jgi:hypothetical protein
MLSGRSGGQTVNGGTLTGQTLSLRDNVVDVNGVDIAASYLAPNADGTIDLGRTSFSFRDLYMFGQAYELRSENVVDGNLTTLTNAAKQGRLVYTTDTGYLAVDNGSAFVKVNNKGYNQLKTNVELGSPVNVAPSAANRSDGVDDARNCIWQLCDTANNEEIMAVEIQKTATTVTIVNDIALPAGNYRLIGIQVN